MSAVYEVLDTVAVEATRSHLRLVGFEVLDGLMVSTVDVHGAPINGMIADGYIETIDTLSPMSSLRLHHFLRLRWRGADTFHAPREYARSLLNEFQCELNQGGLVRPQRITGIVFHKSSGIESKWNWDECGARGFVDEESYEVAAHEDRPLWITNAIRHKRLSLRVVSTPSLFGVSQPHVIAELTQPSDLGRRLHRLESGDLIERRCTGTLIPVLRSARSAGTIGN